MNFLAIAVLIGSLYGQGYYFARSDAGGGGGGAVSFSKADIEDGEADPGAVTVNPTEGNLMVVIAHSRDGVSEASFTISGTGWTKRIARDIEIADANARHTFVIWSKVAGASEDTAISVDNGGAGAKRIQYLEFLPSVAADWTFEASSSADSGTGSTSPLSSGSTASVSAGDLLVIGVGAWRNGSGTPGSIAFTNGIIDVGTGSAGTDNSRVISSGWLYTTTGGAKETEVSWTGSGHEAACAILVFSAVPQ